MAIETMEFHDEFDQFDPARAVAGNGSASVAVVDEHDAIHAAVELWCSQSEPPIRFAGNYFSADQFLAEHPSPSASGVGPIVLELQKHRNGVDFASLDRIVSRRHRVIVYSHIATDEVILTALDRGAVTYLTKSERKDHLIDAIRAAGTDTPYVGPRMAMAMLNDGTVGRANLAPREKEVLVAWFRTESKDIVASQLHIAPTTVRTCSECGRSTPRWDDPPQRRPRWWRGRFRTASSTSTTSSRSVICGVLKNGSAARPLGPRYTF